MQFQVPQFLEIEDKIFGPFTFREFAYLAGGAGLCFVLYKLLGLFWGAIPMLLIAGFSLALTFYKPNNKPFINMIEAGFKYFSQSKLYIWKKHAGKTSPPAPLLSGEGGQRPGEVMTRLNGSRLRDLAWSLDVLDLSKNKERQL
jgi:hypothetical protein